MPGVPLTAPATPAVPLTAPATPAAPLTAFAALAALAFFSSPTLAAAQDGVALKFRIEPELPVYFVGQQVAAILEIDAKGYELDGETRLSKITEQDDSRLDSIGPFTARAVPGSPRLAAYAAPMRFVREGEATFAPELEGRVAAVETRGIFTSKRLYPFKAAAAPVAVKVKPLPLENRPANFSGAIGNFKLEASLEPRDCSPGDLLNLNWSLAGDSAFNSPQNARYSPGKGFRAYPPRAGAASVPGLVSGSQVVIPLDTNSTSAAAFEITVFNPTKQKYETLRAGPFDLRITERADAAAATNALPSIIFSNAAGGADAAAAAASAQKNSAKQPFSFGGLFKRGTGSAAALSARASAKLCPDSASKTLFEIPPAASVEIRARHGGWAFVMHNGASGWVPEKLLEK